MSVDTMSMIPVTSHVMSCMYVCVNGHTYCKSKGQPGKVANPARGQQNRENEYFPVPIHA